MIREQRENLHSPHEEGYLLLVRCESGTDHVPACPKWTGKDVLVEPKAETTIALSHIQVS
jgi:mitogen-activated protein kinase kinase kinase 4